MSDRRPTYEATAQVIRMLQLLERSHGRALPLNRVARELGVHRRTVVRWVKALEATVDNELGEPLLRRSHRAGEAWVTLPASGPPLGGTIFQYAAVRLAMGALRGDAGSLLADSAQGVVQRLEEAGGWRLAPALRRVDTAFHYLPFGPKDHRDREDVLDAVVQGLLRQQRLAIRYAIPGREAAPLRVDPLTLVLYRDGFYLLGRRRWRGGPALRTYALSRVEAAEVLRDQRFELPEGYDPKAVFADGLGIFEGWGPPERVRLAFAPTAAVVARERRWPGLVGWSSEGERDVLELELPVTPEVVSWALSWGAELEVLVPDALRSQVRRQLQAALAAYGARASR